MIVIIIIIIIFIWYETLITLKKILKSRNQVLTFCYFSLDYA